MNNQQAFDKMVTHLRKQGIRSEFSELNTCLLKWQGLKCAIGALIPDEEYSPKLEELGLKCLMLEVDVLQPLEFEFLLEMRDSHDDLEPRHWEQAWWKIANDFGLEYSAP